MALPLRAAALSLVLLATPAFAQDTSSSLPATASEIAPLPVTDPQDFANRAAIGNLFEIQSSQLALNQASDATVKQFAQQMIDDHSKADASFKQAVSAQGGLSLPTALDQKHQDLLTQLQGLTGADFDTLYVQAQTDAHIEAVGLFAGFATGSATGPLKDFAAATLPTLQQHYELVKALPR